MKSTLIVSPVLFIIALQMQHCLILAEISILKPLITCTKSSYAKYIVNKRYISLRKQPTFHEVATWALAKRRLIVTGAALEMSPHLWRVSTQILVVLLIGWNFNQSEALPRSA